MRIIITIIIILIKIAVKDDPDDGEMGQRVEQKHMTCPLGNLLLSVLPLNSLIILLRLLSIPLIFLSIYNKIPHKANIST
jgi:hypothetical protein